MSCNHTPKTFDSAILAELAGGFLLDNGMCSLEVAAEEAGTGEQLLELTVHARVLFLMVTLACRGLDRTRDCAELLRSLLGVYCQAQSAWEGICSGDEVSAYLAQLGRLIELVGDRLELYGEEGWEREVLVARKSW